MVDDLDFAHGERSVQSPQPGNETAQLPPLIDFTDFGNVDHGTVATCIDRIYTYLN